MKSVMYSIDVTEDWNDEFKYSHVTLTLKMLYAIKLQYPEGIEIDIPRTFRSVYQFSFTINRDSLVFAEHWEWLIQAIMTNSTYELKFDKRGHSTIQLKDGALSFTVGSRATSRHYVPLEYHRTDIIEMCRQIQAIYARRASDMQFEWYKPDLLSIPLDQFPVIQVDRQDDRRIIKCYFDHYDTVEDKHIYIDRPHQDQLRVWFESLINGQSHNPCLSFNGGHTFFRDVGNSVEVSNIYGDKWSLPYSLIPKCLATLS